MTRPKKLNFLITAGPTREPIDAVRFISNYATGTLGYRIAAAALSKGHRVALVSGPTCLRPPKKTKYIPINTAVGMLSVLKREIRKADVLIMSAAVSDFRPAHKKPHKIKKEAVKKGKNNRLNLKLKENPDILKKLSKYKKNKLYIGFCLETSKLKSNARKKLLDKKLDYIVGFKKTAKNEPFGEVLSDVIICDKSLKINTLKKISKNHLAERLIDISQKVCYT